MVLPTARIDVMVTQRKKKKHRAGFVLCFAVRKQYFLYFKRMVLSQCALFQELKGSAKTVQNTKQWKQCTSLFFIK